MRGINDLESYYDTTQFLGMTFYFGFPYATTEGNNRAGWYGIDGTPTAVFGGDDMQIGASGTMFDTYNPMVMSQLATASPLDMSSEFVMVGDEVTLSVQIDVDLAVSGNNVVYFFVCQDGLHSQSNMVVEVLPSQTFTLTTPGQTVTLERSFTMDPTWTESALRLITVVQNLSTKEIHQANLAIPNYAAAVIIDNEPDGVEASWHLVGPNLDITSDSDKAINLWAPGTYTITWEDIPYWTSPANNPETLTVAEDGSITFLGVYSDGPFGTATAGALGDAGSGQAVSLIDIDNDGDLDIHVANEGTVDQMLRNDGGQVFSDIAAGPIAEAGASRGAAWADVNGDGNLDVFLSRNNEANLLMFGDGSGGFTTTSTINIDDAGPGSSASWIDFNQDDLMDLYVVNEGEANNLLKGFGDIGGGMYLYATVSGAAADASDGSASCWNDADLDGFPDLFVANQFQTNLFLQNLDGDFFDMTHQAGLTDSGKAMGAAWGDYDNDGEMDLYVANEGMRDVLYHSLGGFHFAQILGDNLGDTGEGRGVVWVDFNNDTFLDLYVVRNTQTDLLLLGDGAGNFQRIPVGPPEADGPGNAVACGDIDDDGDIDLFISREGASNALLVNELAGSNRWIKLQLTGTGTNTCAIGARVVLTTGGISQTRMVSSGSGYLCNNSLDLHFGLGAATTVDQIEIVWPGGTLQTVGPTFSNQTLAIVQGQDLASGVEDAVPTRATVLGLAHPNPFNPSTTIEFALARPQGARLDVYTVDGRLVRTLVDRDLAAGPHSTTWDGTDQSGRAVASGTYFYRLTTHGGFSEAGRMVLVK